MTKKRSKLAVKGDLSVPFDAPIENPAQPTYVSQNFGLPIRKALEIVVKQMTTAGLRSRTHLSAKFN
ncbi:hypothetical protein AB1K83_07400 [Sporosarcina sp. 179-K 3D1 HS]|uniref:hypothetical protein n=1 Tax=Sporosarcina sp. 179-K 3D1 HS TaxID=3232169 RepID=UPI0039A2E1EE